MISICISSEIQDQLQSIPKFIGLSEIRNAGGKSILPISLDVLSHGHCDVTIDVGSGLDRCVLLLGEHMAPDGRRALDLGLKNVELGLSKVAGT